MQTLHVYLAGPDVFFKDPIAVGNSKKTFLETLRLQGRFPMDPMIDNFAHDRATALRIAEGNEELMSQSQVILANMTPWHGPSMDVGTAFEVGFMRARSLFHPESTLIIGYYEKDIELDFAKRVANDVYQGAVHFAEDGSVVDEEGISLENFALSENLMIVSAIQKTGGKIFLSFEEAARQIIPLWMKKQALIKGDFYSPAEAGL